MNLRPLAGLALAALLSLSGCNATATTGMLGYANVFPAPEGDEVDDVPVALFRFDGNALWLWAAVRAEAGAKYLPDPQNPVGIPIFGPFGTVAGRGFWWEKGKGVQVFEPGDTLPTEIVDRLVFWFTPEELLRMPFRVPEGP